MKNVSRIIAGITLFLLINGCGDESSTSVLFNPEAYETKYLGMLNRVHKQTKNESLENIPELLETSLRDSIFDYWYGTLWGFYGTSPKPRQGKIACGYFVTTTLKHLGLNINHIHLAQQAASEIIKEICDEPSIKSFSNSHYKQMLEYVKKHPGKIFIIGLDNHVGYLVKKGAGLYFVHSGGGYPRSVVMEKATIANQIKWSKFHMVGHINFKNWARGLKQGN